MRACASRVFLGSLQIYGDLFCKAKENPFLPRENENRHRDRRKRRFPNLFCVFAKNWEGCVRDAINLPDNPSLLFLLWTRNKEREDENHRVGYENANGLRQDFALDLSIRFFQSMSMSWVAPYHQRYNLNGVCITFDSYPGSTVHPAHSDTIEWHYESYMMRPLRQRDERTKGQSERQSLSRDFRDASNASESEGCQEGIAFSWDA